MRCSYLATLVWLAVAPPLHSALIPVDDRGRPLTEPVEACFRVELAQQCTTVSPGSSIELPSVFSALRVEGPGHGPILRTFAELAEAERQARALAIPRKATLEVEGDPEVVSLYAPDGELLEPAVRIAMNGRKTIRVPADSWIISLYAVGSAPDLEALSLAAGDVHRLRFTKRPGWSAVVRAVMAERATPVSGSQVSIRPAPGYSLGGPTAELQGKTNAGGWAVFEGLTAPLVEATVSHRDFLPMRLAGLIATPGTFAFRRAELRPGATAMVRVVYQGKAVPDATCEIREYTWPPRWDLREAVYSGKTSIDGVCRSARLPDGEYVLDIKVPRLRAATDTSFAIAAGVDVELDVELVRAEVSGRVTLGEDPAVGFIVEAHNRRTKQRGNEDNTSDRATTSDDGTYEMVLWSAGNFVFTASTAAGTPAALQMTEIELGQNNVDFKLAAGSVAGVVVDQEGRPIEGVDIVLEAGVPKMSRVGRTAIDGTFYFPLETSGAVFLRALKRGYAAKTVDLQLDPGVASPRLEIILTREQRLQGVLLSASGRPVSGGWLSIWTVDAQGQQQPAGEGTTDNEGHFDLPSTTTAAVGFTTGPGCPLTLFRVEEARRDATVRCAAGLSAATLDFSDEDQGPFAGARLILVRDGVVIPSAVLARHQRSLGLTAESDGLGRLTLAGLAPGEYRVYLVQATNASLAWLESDQGFLGTFSLPLGGHVEYGITIEREKLPNLTGPGT